MPNPYTKIGYNFSTEMGENPPLSPVFSYLRSARGLSHSI